MPKKLKAGEKRMKKRIVYEVVSEFGTLRFYKYKRLIEFLTPYVPKHIDKIGVYKKVGDIRYSGQYRRDNRWPVIF